MTVVNYEVGGDWTPWPWLATNLSVYDSNIRNEIVFAASSRTAGFFRNVPRTRRRGLEVGARAERQRGAGTLRAYAQYAYVSARYGSSVQLASALPNEPPVTPGDRMPLSPAHRASVGVGATVVTRSSVFDGDLRVRGVSHQFLRGDEANVQAPIPGYAVTSSHLSARVARYTFALDVDNLLGARFATFGTFAPDPTASPGPSGAPPVVRFLTPAYPRSMTLSVSATW